MDPTSTPLPTECATAARSHQSWTRRRWLAAGGVLAGAGVAVGAGWLFYDRQQRFGAPPQGRVRDHRVTPATGAPRLVVARGKDPAANVRAALDRIGGIRHFVKPGDVVLVKPNIAWERTPAQAANTDPTVLAAVVRACREAGASEVVVCDCPVNDAERTFVMSGLKAAATAAGARVLLPGDAGVETVRLSAELGNWPVFSPLLRADKIINVPVAKHHGQSRLTAGMKNWFGITLHQRGRFHAALDRTIVDLAAVVQPTLTVVDATRILMRNGPRGGNLGDVRQADTVAVSTDPVALDVWAADLLGAPHDKVPYLALAADRKLGRLDYRAQGMVEINT